MLITLSRSTKTKLPYVCPLKQGFSIRIPFRQQAQGRRLHDFWPQFRLSCINRDQCVYSSEWAANILETLLDIFGDCKLDILMQKARKLKAKQDHVSSLNHLLFRIWVCFLVHGVEWLMMVLSLKSRFYWNLLRHYHDKMRIRSKKWLWLVLFRMCYGLNAFVSPQPPSIHTLKS